MAQVIRAAQSAEIISELQAIKTSVQNIDTNTDQLEAKIDSTITLLTTISNKDFATETTLVAIDAVLDNILLEAQSIDANTDGLEALLTTLNAKDFATSAKQDSIIAELQDIEELLGGAANTVSEATVAQSATSVTLLAANTTRVRATVRNNAQGNQTLYISKTGTASANSPIALAKGDIYIIDDWDGILTGIWSSGGSGDAKVEELYKV